MESLSAALKRVGGNVEGGRMCKLVGDATGVLDGNPWQQLLLSHFLWLGGQMLAIHAEAVSPWQAHCTPSSNLS